MKSLTRQQLQHRKAQASRFTRDILENEDRADEIEDESLEDCAKSRHIKLTNPKGARKMAVQTRRELLERIEELEGQNEELQSQLDEISDIVSPSYDEEENDNQGSEEEDQGEG